jgi:hypothetical protein
MTTSRQNRIQDITWLAKARALRPAILESLPPDVRPDATFENHDSSAALGKHFWAAVDPLPEVPAAGDFSVTASVLGTPHAWTGRTVVYFHPRTNDAGALRIPAPEFIAAVARLQRDLGPDLLFMTDDCSSGFCYEVLEDGTAVYCHWKLPDPVW